MQEPGLRDPEIQKSYSSVAVGLIAGNVYLFAASQGLAAWFHNCNKAALAAELKLRPEQHVLTPRQWGIRPRADERKPRVRQAEIEAAEDGLSRSVGLDAAIHWPSDFLMIASPARRLHALGQMRRFVPAIRLSAGSRFSEAGHGDQVQAPTRKSLPVNRSKTTLAA